MSSFSVKITELDFDGESTLKIEFSDSTNKYFCEFIKRKNDVLKFCCPPGITSESSNEINVSDIESFFSKLLEKYQFPWNSPEITNFFQNGNKASPLIDMQLSFLQSKVLLLEESNLLHEKKFQDLESKFDKLLNLAQSASNSSILRVASKDEDNTNDRESFELSSNFEAMSSQVSEKYLDTNSDSDKKNVELVTFKELIPQDELNKLANNNDFEDEVDSLIRLMQPRESQFAFRQTAIDKLTSFIHKTLSTNAFDISLHVIRCFLPDDPIKITIVHNNQDVSTWHKVLFDRLTILSNEQEDRLGEPISPFNMKFPGAIEGTQSNPENQLLISEVKLLNTQNSFKVVGLINSTPFEIQGNARVDMCMLAFFEEVNSTIGCDHLLKRSILLIRAWWSYEITNEKSVKEYLPDYALWVMTIAIFNQYHSSISSPAQALYYFILNYSAFDGATMAITLRGIHRFIENSNYVSSWIGDEETVISPKLFDKYYQVINISSDNSSSHLPSQVKVDKCGLTIIHPFNLNIMTLEKLSTRKSAMILSVFKSASTVLLDTLHAKTSEKSIVKNLLIETYRKFVTLNWRPDVNISLNSYVGTDDFENLRSPRDVFNVQMEQLWHNILYCNFILESVVSESALLSLCSEVLIERKILPVGEVGKLVSDITGIPNLSTQLREKFGGLKKFIEKYSEIFLTSKDHPFNPYVVLRKSLTYDQIDMVEKGVVPLQDIFKLQANSQTVTKQTPNNPQQSQVPSKKNQKNQITQSPQSSMSNTKTFQNDPRIISNSGIFDDRSNSSISQFNEWKPQNDPSYPGPSYGLFNKDDWNQTPGARNFKGIGDLSERFGALDDSRSSGTIPYSNPPMNRRVNVPSIALNNSNSSVGSYYHQNQHDFSFDGKSPSMDSRISPFAHQYGMPNNNNTSSKRRNNNTWSNDNNMSSNSYYNSDNSVNSGGFYSGMSSNPSNNLNSSNLLNSMSSSTNPLNSSQQQNNYSNFNNNNSYPNSNW